jgi:AcrR family transcriptional regulator
MPNAVVRDDRSAGSRQPAAERGKEVRHRLLRTAVELIPELGWNAVSTRILAQRAGLAPGLVHYHFESLQALLREAALAGMRESIQAVSAMFQQADTLEGGLDMLLGALDAYSGNDRASLLFVEAYLASLRDPRLAQNLAGLLIDFRHQFAQWLQLHGQLGPESTAAVLAAALDGVLLHRAMGPDLSTSAVREVLGRLLVRADGTTTARRRKAKTGR